MRGLPFFKPKKGAQFAGLGFSDGSGGGSYVLPPATADTLGGVKVGNNLSIDANGVLSTPDGVDPSMIAGTESTTTSTHDYAIGEYFISSTGLLCKATSEIVIDDTISIGTSTGDNAISVTVGGELTELNSKTHKIVHFNRIGWIVPSTITNITLSMNEIYPQPILLICSNSFGKVGAYLWSPYYPGSYKISDSGVIDTIDATVSNELTLTLVATTYVFIDAIGSEADRITITTN